MAGDVLSLVLAPGTLQGQSTGPTQSSARGPAGTAGFCSRRTALGKTHAPVPWLPGPGWALHPDPQEGLRLGGQVSACLGLQGAGPGPPPSRRPAVALRPPPAAPASLAHAMAMGSLARSVERPHFKTEHGSNLTGNVCKTRGLCCLLE